MYVSFIYSASLLALTSLILLAIKGLATTFGVYGVVFGNEIVSTIIGLITFTFVMHSARAYVGLPNWMLETDEHRLENKKDGKKTKETL